MRFEFIDMFHLPECLEWKPSTIIVDYCVMSGQATKMDHIVPDLPRGPMDVYRQRASFNWKEMVLFLEGEDLLELKVAMEIIAQHWDIQT